MPAPLQGLLRPMKLPLGFFFFFFLSGPLTTWWMPCSGYSLESHVLVWSQPLLNIIFADTAISNQSWSFLCLIKWQMQIPEICSALQAADFMLHPTAGICLGWHSEIQLLKHHIFFLFLFCIILYLTSDLKMSLGPISLWRTFFLFM